MTVAAGALLTGAEPVPPRPFPPLPVPPVERRSMPPYFARITITGDPRMKGDFEDCVDPAAMFRSAEARAKARPADAPPPMTGCATAHETRPDGSVHTEMSCDQAKGAKATFHRTSDGTPNDLRSHADFYAAGSDVADRKMMTIDSHIVMLGACPADLKPGEMRRVGGPVIEPGEAARLRAGARGAPG